MQPSVPRPVRSPGGARRRRAPPCRMTRHEVAARLVPCGHPMCRECRYRRNEIRVLTTTRADAPSGRLEDPGPGRADQCGGVVAACPDPVLKELEEPFGSCPGFSDSAFRHHDFAAVGLGLLEHQRIRSPNPKGRKRTNATDLADTMAAGHCVWRNLLDRWTARQCSLLLAGHAGKVFAAFDVKVGSDAVEPLGYPPRVPLEQRHH